MPVMSCGGAAPCNRLISISAIEGGNPSAKADPEAYASEWTRCRQCSTYTCDRCLGRQGGKCKCGAPASVLPEPQRIQIARDMMLGGASAGPQAVAVARITPPSQGGLPPNIAALDASTQFALWVTLAFLDVAMADGNAAESEFVAWKTAIQRMKLPDVWQQFGLQNLHAMLQAGVLQQLSVSFANFPGELRGKMATMLVEFMVADGNVHPNEIATIKKIGSWIGVNLEIGSG